MIALLTGKVVSKAPGELVLDVSGVGYHVGITLTTFERLPEAGETITMHIFTYVREDTLALYGFMTPDEKLLFTKLLKVSGIGPKLAVAILSGVPPRDLVDAIMSEDLARLNAIPGVGRKTAERIIIDLKDKLVAYQPGASATASAARKSTVYDDALSALVNLGYNRVQAERTLGTIGVAKDADLSSVIKDALKELSAR